VVREDDILQEKVMSMLLYRHLECLLTTPDIENIERKRHANPETDVVYIISPQSHIVDCLLHDIGKRRYRRTFLLWTSGASSVL
jgi:hypothetical protein